MNVDEECKVDGVSHVARDPPHGAGFDAGSEAKLEDQGPVPGQLEACVEVESSADELETTGFGSDPQIGPCKQGKFPQQGKLMSMLTSTPLFSLRQGMLMLMSATACLQSIAQLQGRATKPPPPKVVFPGSDQLCLSC